VPAEQAVQRDRKAVARPPPPTDVGQPNRLTPAKPAWVKILVRDRVPHRAKIVECLV
jgi:hypothetical protein